MNSERNLQGKRAEVWLNEHIRTGDALRPALRRRLMNALTSIHPRNSEICDKCPHDFAYLRAVMEEIGMCPIGIEEFLTVDLPAGTECECGTRLELDDLNVDLEGEFIQFVDGTPVDWQVLQRQLAKSTRRLPRRITKVLGFPPGTTFGHAVRTMIVVPVPNRLIRLHSTLDFTEAESLEWWERNKNNPERIIVAIGESGSAYVVHIAV